VPDRFMAVEIFSSGDNRFYSSGLLNCVKLKLPNRLNRQLARVPEQCAFWPVLMEMTGSSVMVTAGRDDATSERSWNRLCFVCWYFDFRL